MKKHNMGTGLVCVIEPLYEISYNAILLDGAELKRSQTTMGVGQGCILSPGLFNIFLEQIMNYALEGLNGSVSKGGRNLNNLCFADNIDHLASNVTSNYEVLRKRQPKNCLWQEIIQRKIGIFGQVCRLEDDRSIKTGVLSMSDGTSKRGKCQNVNG